jgi:hypothetical protein
MSKTNSLHCLVQICQPVIVEKFTLDVSFFTWTNLGLSQQSDHTAVDARIGRILIGSDCRLIETLSQKLHQGTEENYLHIRIVEISAQIRSEYLQNVSLEGHQKVNISVESFIYEI